jgi:hypothetical protein
LPGAGTYVATYIVLATLSLPAESFLFFSAYACFLLFLLLGRGSDYTVILIRCISHLFGWMSLDFIARGYGLAAPSARLLQATFLALLADLV